MFVLGLLTVASVFGCCIGYTVVKRPAKYYNYHSKPQNYYHPSEYQWQPVEYQWQSLPYQYDDYQSYDYPHYDYQSYNYQPYSHETYNYPSYNYPSYNHPSYNYPSDNHPSYNYPSYNHLSYNYQSHDYTPYEYQPSHSGYYYYNHYPHHDNSVPSGYATEPKLSHADAQKLLQVYRLIRVIEVFQDPTLIQIPSLTGLVHKLKDPTLEQKLVDLLITEPGFKDVATLKNDPSIKVLSSFVNDHERLLLAIQRALNALNLDIELDDALQHKLRELKDQANALTGEQIGVELLLHSKGHVKEVIVVEKPELVHHSKGHGKEVVDVEKPEIIADINELEKLLEEYSTLVDKADHEPLKSDVVDEVNKETQQEVKETDELDGISDDDLAAALEMYLEQQEIAKTTEETSTVEYEQDRELLMATTTHAPQVPLPTEATSNHHWLGSLLGPGNLLSGHYGSTDKTTESQNLPQPIDVSQPAVLLEPETLDGQNAWVYEEDSQGKDGLEFDIDQRFQSQNPTATTTETATHSVPLWLIDNAKNQNAETKQTKAEDVTEGAEELQRQLTDKDQLELDHERKVLKELKDLIEKDRKDLQKNEETTTEAVTEVTTEGETRAMVVDEGPTRFNFPTDISKSTSSSTPEPLPIKPEPEIQQTTVTPDVPSVTPVVDRQTTPKMNEAQSESTPIESRTDPVPVTETEISTTPESVEQSKAQQPKVTPDVSSTTVRTLDQRTRPATKEVRTESDPIESRTEPVPVTETATTEPDARRIVRKEVLKVLNLLEESNGITELSERITEQDLNELVDELTRDQRRRVKWTELMSALQRLVARKNLNSGKRLLTVLELWKDSEHLHLDDGYFERTYGENDSAASRQIPEDLVDVEERKMKQLQAAIMESRYSEQDVAEAEARTQRVEESTPVATKIPELEPTTQDSQVVDETSTLPSPQAGGATDKLDSATTKPFPATKA